MKALVEQLYREIWNGENFVLLSEIVADNYKIHRDAGDHWEGKSLDHDEYKKRVMYSKTAFPDLIFNVEKVICQDKWASVLWSAEGTQSGDLAGIPATGKLLNFNGQTIYELESGKIAGHWQVMDRVGFYQQITQK